MIHRWSLLVVLAAAACRKGQPAAVHVELTLQSVGNTMAFDKPALTVPAGAEVHVTFRNNSTMAMLPHNWVLVRPGREDSVAAAGLSNGAPAVDLDGGDVLAFARLARQGESTEVSFKAPATPGAYPYICSVPDHAATMKGVLTVTP